jgi:hypothetical protein
MRIHTEFHHRVALFISRVNKLNAGKIIFYLLIHVFRVVAAGVAATLARLKMIDDENEIG